jgi:hypothetical protein
MLTRRYHSPPPFDYTERERGIHTLLLQTTLVETHKRSFPLNDTIGGNILRELGCVGGKKCAPQNSHKSPPHIWCRLFVSVHLMDFWAGRLWWPSACVRMHSQAQEGKLLGACRIIYSASPLSHRRKAITPSLATKSHFSQSIFAKTSSVKVMRGHKTCSRINVEQQHTKFLGRHGPKNQFCRGNERLPWKDWPQKS